MYQKDKGKFIYQPGALMCNLFLADEINRTSPKTQSALLEVMEERQVTVDQRTYEVPEPFIVIATENPFGSAGTQMLPESQLDRFMICISMGYPDIQSEICLLYTSLSIPDGVVILAMPKRTLQLETTTSLAAIPEMSATAICQ